LSLVGEYALPAWVCLAALPFACLADFILALNLTQWRNRVRHEFTELEHAIQQFFAQGTDNQGYKLEKFDSDGDGQSGHGLRPPERHPKKKHQFSTGDHLRDRAYEMHSVAEQQAGDGDQPAANSEVGSENVSLAALSSATDAALGHDESLGMVLNDIRSAQQRIEHKLQLQHQVLHYMLQNGAWKE
jgi:hypothetical protein